MGFDFKDCPRSWFEMDIFPENGGIGSFCCHHCPPGGAYPFPMDKGASIGDLSIRRATPQRKPNG
jgi:hypothetical protein